MEAEIQLLKLKLEDAQLALEEEKRERFSINKFKDSDDDIHFYTGFPDYKTLSLFYKECLEEDAKEMRYWHGSKTQSDKTNGDFQADKVGRKHALPLEEQFFLVLVRLRLGLLEQDLAERFRVSQATVSRYTITWINLMYHVFKEKLARFPSQHIVQKYMPSVFQEKYPATRVIIDATEFSVDRPTSLVAQAASFSSYKNRNTAKVLIGIMPSGPVTFVSEVYEGSISDRELFIRSGLLSKLEEGDEVMADKGFTIQDVFNLLALD